MRRATIRNPHTRAKADILRVVNLKVSEVNSRVSSSENDAQSIGFNDDTTGLWNSGWLLGISGLGEDTLL